MRLITLLAALALTSCTSYEFGDGTREILERRTAYCEATDPEIKAAAYIVVKSYLPDDYPERSICEPGFIADVLGIIADDGQTQ